MGTNFFQSVTVGAGGAWSRSAADGQSAIRQAASLRYVAPTGSRLYRGLAIRRPFDQWVLSIWGRSAGLEACATKGRASSFFIRLSSFGCLLLAAAVSPAQVVNFSSSAGNAGQGSALFAPFDQPAGMARDSAGNLYVTDSGNNCIREISGAGSVVSVFAGTPGVAGSNNGLPAFALFNQPVGLAVDGAGNVYVADSGNDTIREITTKGFVITLAGQVGVAGSVNATGTNALFNEPQGIALDANTNLYVADYGNDTVRVITPAGVVTTLAGLAGVPGSADGTGTSALFNEPQGVAVDGSTNVYVTDTANGTIRKITPGGTVTTLAGYAGNLGSSDGTGTNAQFYQPEGITLDSATNLYVADYFNQTIRKITPAGVVVTLAGSPGLAGSVDGVTNSARFWGPLGMVTDASTNLYVADHFNGTLREITLAGVVTTLAGSPSAASVDGPAASARFNLPVGAAVDSSGNVYVADSVNSTIRKITGGQVVTFAGSPGNFGSLDASGTNALLNGPQSVAVDTTGNIYVADTLNDSIRKISSQGAVTTFAGFPGSPGNVDGQGTNAQFFHPQGIAVDLSNNIYVADTGNNTIRKITSGGLVSTLAGLAGYFGSIDGTNSAVRFNGPQGLATDSSGNIYVADYNNEVIREITPAGQSSTLAGLAGVWGSVDGSNNTARFFGPAGVAVDAGGNVYIADSGNQTLRLMTPAGTNWVVTTVAGLPGAAGSANGSGSGVRFNFPTGVALDASEGVYVADSANNEVRVQGMADGANGLALLTDYILGISPNDPSTVLNFGIAPAANGFQTVFSPWTSGRTYQLQATTNLASPVWITVPNVTATQVGGQGVITGTNLTGSATFYRLAVQLSP
jgi:sugar lactone lactonase YvrE